MNTIIKNVIYQQMNKIGIFSLSKNYKNILMWSHYADNHTSLVFEFTDFINLETRIIKPTKVDYLTEYKKIKPVLNNSNKNEKYNSKEFQRLVLTKSKDWEYEEEYRVFDIDNYGLYKFEKKELASIIFGLKTTKENINKYINLCKGNGFEHVQFKQIVKKEGYFELTENIKSIIMILYIIVYILYQNQN